jgi:hypothetical protein
VDAASAAEGFSIALYVADHTERISFPVALAGLGGAGARHRRTRQYVVPRRYTGIGRGRAVKILPAWHPFVPAARI